MRHEILITTFDTWKDNQRSNSSDDLLHLLEELEYDFFHSLRRIPVCFELSPQHVMEHFERLQPKVLICCGMAEERDKLNVESRAIHQEVILETTIDLEALTADLPMTEISNDAGRFVCNTLYYTMLEHLHAQEEDYHCVFVHVPVLTKENRERILADFIAITERLADKTTDRYFKG